MVDEKPQPIDLNSKVGDMTVHQLFNVLDALVNKSLQVNMEEIAKAQNRIAQAEKLATGPPKIITPAFTPKSAQRYAKRHPDA